MFIHLVNDILWNSSLFHFPKTVVALKKHKDAEQQFWKCLTIWMLEIQKISDILGGSGYGIVTQEKRKYFHKNVNHLEKLQNFLLPNLNQFVQSVWPSLWPSPLFPQLSKLLRVYIISVIGTIIALITHVWNVSHMIFSPFFSFPAIGFN